MLKVNIILYMNHVIHHIETPPGLTPPRLLAGGWEGKVLYVDSQHYVIIYEPRDSSYVESQYLELRHTKMRGGRGPEYRIPGQSPKSCPQLNLPAIWVGAKCGNMKSVYI